jgi:plasmid stabilization system protein ParE
MGDAVVASIECVAENAQLGAPCSFDEDELHGIRRISSTGFAKHSAFYQVGKRELIILRVAYGARDLESLF